MIIETAGFGDVNGGHALLGFSGDQPLKLSDIIGRTDKPPYAPPDLKITPFISGFCWKEKYVLMKTIPDPGASRAGMVFSFALLIDLKDAIVTEDLRPLIELLPTGILRDKYEPIILNTLDKPSYSPLNSALVEAIVSAQPGESVVWVGEEGFYENLISLWRCLWPAARQSFSFRLAFDPQDIDMDPPSLVLVHPELESRWSNFRSVDARKTGILTLAASALAKLPEGDGVRSLRETMNTRISHPRELRLIEQLYLALTAQSPSISQLRSALHVIAKLCPEDSDAAPEKSQLIDKLVRVIAREANPSEIRAFRNLDLRPFAGREVLLVSLEDWVAENTLEIASDKELRTLLQLALERENIVGGRVREGIKSCLKASTDQTSAVLWNWIVDLPAGGPGLISIAVESWWTDARIAANCPARLSTEVADPLLHFFKNQQMFVSYAATATACFAPNEALLAVLDSTALSMTEVQRTLSERLPGRELLGFAIENGAEASLDLATKSIRSEPKLLNRCQMLNANWRRLVDRCIEKGIDAFGQIDDWAISFTALDFVLDSGTISTTTWRNLADSKFADVASYPRRPELWGVIPSEFRPQFLAATAKTILKSLFESNDNRLQDESELRKALLTDALRATLDIQQIVHLSEFLDLSEDSLISLLHNSAVVLVPYFAAESLGKLITRKKWERAANYVFGRSERRADLLPALANCVSLLTRWQRLNAIWIRKVNNTAPSPNDVWSALEDLGNELYSWGPLSHDVWQRAGGDPSAIRAQSTGRESWHDAISQAQKGGGGKVTQQSLTMAMLQDYHWNEVLQSLAQHLGT